MSIFHTARMTCPACGAVTEVQRSASVNADRRPDLRDAIVDGTFQAAACSKCGATLRLDSHLTYMDIGGGLWVAAAEPGERENWPAVEAASRATFDRSFGQSAPQSGRELGEGVRPRLVFGWPALREKLVCAGLGLDDVAVEMVKMAAIANVDGSPVADETELRLTSGDEQTLNFTWIATFTEDRLSSLAIPRELYDGIAGDADWAPVRSRFDGAMFVDVARFMLAPDVAEAAD